VTDPTVASERNVFFRRHSFTVLETVDPYENLILDHRPSPPPQARTRKGFFLTLPGWAILVFLVLVLAGLALFGGMGPFPY
jgi:hypothetical protein